MKILHVSSTGSKGGAGTATGRLHAALKRLGIQSDILSLDGTESDREQQKPSAVWPDFYRSVDLELAQTVFVEANRTDISNTLFSLGLPGPDISQHPAVTSADIIHLHWVNGLLGLPAIADIMNLDKPVVWTFHDQWPFTGGCHYSAGCGNYATGCMACPQLKLAQEELPRAIFADKQTMWTGASTVTVVALTQWMESCVQQSGLFQEARIRLIPNGLDLAVFTPARRDEARKKLGLAPDTKVCLFVSQSINERRKGYPVLKKALEIALKNSAYREAIKAGRIIFACLGHDADPAAEVPLHHWGWMNNEQEIADCYAAADVFIAPSLEDNLPNTVVESLASGTPVIGSSAGGIPEMLLAEQTGWILPAGQAAPLAKCLLEVLSDPNRFAAMRDACRKQAEAKYSDQLNAGKMAQLYRELLALPPRQQPDRTTKALCAPYGPAMRKFLFSPPTTVPAGSLRLVAEGYKKEIQGMYAYILTIEADRATRLTAIEKMQTQLAIHGEARQKAEARVVELEQTLRGTQDYLATTEADRSTRLAVIERMQAQLTEHGQARQNAEARVVELEQALKGTQRFLATVEADSASRLSAIEAMQAQLAEHGQGRQIAEARVAELEQALKGTQRFLATVETDSASRLSAIEAMQAQLAEQGQGRQNAEARVAELEQALRGTNAYLASAEADRAARLAAIEQMQAQLAEHGQARQNAEARVAELEQALKGTNDYLLVVEADRAARLDAILSLQKSLQEIQQNPQQPSTH